MKKFWNIITKTIGTIVIIIMFLTTILLILDKLTKHNLNDDYQLDDEDYDFDDFEIDNLDDLD